MYLALLVLVSIVISRQNIIISFGLDIRFMNFSIQLLHLHRSHGDWNNRTQISALITFESLFFLFPILFWTQLLFFREQKLLHECLKRTFVRLKLIDQIFDIGLQRIKWMWASLCRTPIFTWHKGMKPNMRNRIAFSTMKKKLPLKLCIELSWQSLS